MDRLLGMQLFIRVVETGSFSKASADLGITQPTATKHVAALEQRLGARLFHRSTRGVTPTEIGTLYYDKCILITRELEEADNLAALQQSRVRGQLRVSTSVGFGRRVLVPLVIEFMRQHPELHIDLGFDDRYVNLVEQGVDVAIRMGQLADSSLGASYLGINPWVVVASPAYLDQHGTPAHPEELGRHAALIYSTVQGDERWRFVGPGGQALQVPVQGPLRSNNLSALLAATRAGMGLAALPWYVAHTSVHEGAVRPVLSDWNLPSQEIHAVFPSPRLVPTKVTGFIAWLQGHFDGEWWQRSRP
ncbi:MAG TPA: LysR family transcriptional regulator [Ideonella sp.]|nr:LysR family transcriptional regulator [Ideonella sp.]